MTSKYDYSKDDPHQKPRPDAVLMTLPDDRQAEIYEHARTHSCRTTAKWLATNNIHVSSKTVVTFWHWYDWRQLLRDNAATVALVLENMKQSSPEITAREMDAAGQAFFTALAIKQKDSLSWKRTQDVKLRSKALELMKDKFEFNAAEAALKHADKLKAIARNNQLTVPEKVDLVRKRIFGTVPSA